LQPASDGLDGALVFLRTAWDTVAKRPNKRYLSSSFLSHLAHGAPTMPGKSTTLAPHNAPRKNAEREAGRPAGSSMRLPRHGPDTITWWAAQYFVFEVTTSAASRKVRQRDLRRFAEFMRVQAQTEQRRDWTP
jgi:hypothetical protein